MTLVEKLHLLQGLPSFGSLSLSEISSLAEVAVLRVFSPGELLASKGSPMQRLYVSAKGSFADAKKNTLPPVIGLRSILFDFPLKESIYASSKDGAHALSFSRKHIFTLVYECPGFTVNFLQPLPNR